MDQDPLYMAIADGDINQVQDLLQTMNPLENNALAMREAVINKQPAIVQLLANYPGVLISTINYYLEGMYVDELFIDLLRRLAEYTGAFSDSDEDMMVWAAAVGSLPLVEYWIDEGVDPTYDNNSAIASARHYGHSDVVEYLSIENNI